MSEFSSTDAIRFTSEVWPPIRYAQFGKISGHLATIYPQQKCLAELMGDIFKSREFLQQCCMYEAAEASCDHSQFYCYTHQLIL